MKSLIADAHATSAGLLARNSEVVVAPLERNVEGIARIDDHLVLLRVLALEHWMAGIEALFKAPLMRFSGSIRLCKALLRLY